MNRFVAGSDRTQSTLLPECLDDFIDESNPIRVIDAFVDALNVAELGFDVVEPAVTGRPAYHPFSLLKLSAMKGSSSLFRASRAAHN
jgi:transposase